jgi:hypothetical protein
VAKRRPPDPEPAHPLARHVAGAFAQISDYRRAPASRRAKNRVLRAGSVIQEARSRREPVAAEHDLLTLAASVHRACIEVLKALPADQLRPLLDDVIAAEPDEVKRRVWSKNVALYAKFPDLCVTAVARLDQQKGGERGTL